MPVCKTTDPSPAVNTLLPQSTAFHYQFLSRHPCSSSSNAGSTRPSTLISWVWVTACQGQGEGIGFSVVYASIVKAPYVAELSVLNPLVLSPWSLSPAPLTPRLNKISFPFDWTFVFCILKSLERSLWIQPFRSVQYMGNPFPSTSL